ncbi:hypothetical protein [Streptomyces sp. NPDC101234]|uniref:hypothetical protein n=1 Tax=Streptomyces sp. NPDC101234 TaxID=3366138 RepID=UPI00382BF583
MSGSAAAGFTATGVTTSATTYQYTAAGQQHQVTGPDNTVWTFDYDLLGRKKSQTDPDTGGSSYGYDDAGNLISTTDAKHVELGYTYDLLGYPPGDNRVLVADDQSRAAASRLNDTADLPAALVIFYSSIALLHLPDIDHGYFIHTPDLVLDHLTEYGAVRLADHRTGIVFGSDGGGHLFALDQNGQVHRSTTPSWLDDFEPAAPSLPQFLQQLHRATAGFAVDTKRHSAADHG